MVTRSAPELLGFGATLAKLRVLRYVRPRAVPPRRAAGGCDGYAGAYSATAELVAQLQETRAGLLESLVGSLGSRPGGCLSAPACGDLCPAVNFGFPLRPVARALRSHLEPLGRSPAPRHCWRFAGNGHSRPPGPRAIRSPSRRRSLPRWTVNGPIPVPSQATTPA